MDAAEVMKRIEPHLVRQNRPGRGPYDSVPETALWAASLGLHLSLREVMVHALNHGVWPDRFRAQRGTFSAADQVRLLESKVAVIGAGGLGGGVICLLARAGVGRLVVCDHDEFDESNLNRQRLAHKDRLRKSKAWSAKDEVMAINPAGETMVFPVRADRSNLPEILEGADAAADCLDNLAARLDLEDAAAQAGIPYVHAAVAGFEGFLMTVFPGEPGLRALYGDRAPDKDRAAEAILGVPGPTPALAGALQAAEILSLLLGRPSRYRSRLTHFDAAGGSLETLCELAG